MHRRNNKIVLRYHGDDENLFREDYTHHMLMLCYPFFNESDLKLINSYLLKINSPGVLNIVNRNREIFEPASETENQLLFTATGEIANTLELTNSTESGNIGFSTATTQPESVEIDIFVNYLNVQQRAVFNVVAGWAKEKVKYSNSVTPKYIKPLILFITGGAGVGKSRLIETCSPFLIKTFNSYTGSPEKAEVLLLAPTGFTAINILGTTVNSGLAIPMNIRGPLRRMSDQIKCKLLNLYSELEVIIIDEISMVSNKTLFNVHKRFCETFGRSEANPFAGKTVLLLGDLLQLPPVKAQRVFAPLSSLFVAMCNLWTNFLMCELTEVMRQQGDKEFITLLNSQRIGNLSDDHARMPQSRQISIETLSNDVNVLFAENDRKDSIIAQN